MEPEKNVEKAEDQGTANKSEEDAANELPSAEPVDHNEEETEKQKELEDSLEKEDEKAEEKTVSVTAPDERVEDEAPSRADEPKEEKKLDEPRGDEEGDSVDKEVPTQGLPCDGETKDGSRPEDNYPTSLEEKKTPQHHEPKASEVSC